MALIQRWEGWGGVIFFDEKGRSKCAQKMYISVQCVPQGSHLTTLPISFYLFLVPRVNAVLQPTKWREGREGERKKGGGGVGCSEMHCREGAGRGSRDPCNVVGILMSHKVAKDTKEQSAQGSVAGKHIHNTLTHMCRRMHDIHPFPKLTGERKWWNHRKPEGGKCPPSETLWTAVMRTGIWMRCLVQFHPVQPNTLSNQSVKSATLSQCPHRTWRDANFTPSCERGIYFWPPFLSVTTLHSPESARYNNVIRDKKLETVRKSLRNQTTSFGVLNTSSFKYQSR